jgi:hypothetical protein
MVYKAVMIKMLQKPMTLIPKIFLAELKNSREQSSWIRGCKITASEFQKMLTATAVNIDSCKQLRMENYCLKIS